jgi:hypothetical protein
MVELFRDGSAAEVCGKDRHGQGNIALTRHGTCHLISQLIALSVMGQLEQRETP